MAGQEIIIDFTDMIDRVNGFRYLLVAVDAYTGYPEAVPATSATTSSEDPGIPHTAEWVLLRVIKRKWSEPRWTGPFEVVERTSHAVRLKGKAEGVGEAEAEGEEEAIPVKMIGVIIVKIMDTGNVIVERNNVTRDTIEDSSKVLIHPSND
ncbi:hypothetical protein D4764_0197060 [Takifugu flavidus]|uniref:Uncharacterized protein n=1 Tax=Takifugu flavidus TaxID=433684 RepID=A0A5C6MF79_9TELE|nr:hypothetical protein D4764_0197060 [Takifugu flavidus]